MVVDAVLYIFVAWYLDAIVPGNGPPRSIAFPLKKLFSSAKRGYASITGEDMESGIVRDGDREDERELMQSRAVGVSIRNISKQYRSEDRAALTTVSLDLYAGQIFGLLGHNGAGKTTLHSIITGLIQPSSGKVFVEGKDLSDENVSLGAGGGGRAEGSAPGSPQISCSLPRPPKARDELREALGICPQHDILYDRLTVQEHLKLFADIKGGVFIGDFRHGISFSVPTTSPSSSPISFQACRQATPARPSQPSSEKLTWRKRRPSSQKA